MATANATAGRPIPQDYEVAASEFELYEEGSYPAQIVDVQLTANNYKPGQDRFQWKLELPTIEREDGEPAYLYYWTSPSLDSRSHFRKMLVAARRQIPLPGEPGIKPLSLIGEWFSARVIHAVKDDGSVRSQIDDLLPLTPKQRKSITLSMPGTEPETEEEDETPAQVGIDFDKLKSSKATLASHSNAAAAANTAGEDATAAAVAELRPILVMLAESGVRLSKANTGQGLQQLAKSAKTQGVPMADLDFALIGNSTLKLAKAEALALIDTVAPAAAGEEDPFAREDE